MRARELPLLGGEAVIHDWWFLLRHYDALDRDQEIARAIWTGGAVAALFGLAALGAGVVLGRRGD